jgi:ribosome biogenesis GTPase / thiamine phosphate phosphatase
VGADQGAYRWCIPAPSLSVERGRHGTITQLALETRLSALGWTAELDAAFAALECDGLRAGRVASDFGVALRVLTAVGEEQAALAPGLYRQARRGERPVVGDWVALAGESGSACVVERLARRSTFTRRRAGTEQAAREQVIAANVDTAFVVTDPQDFNVRRLERYLAIVREAGAEAVIVLTKLDLYPDVPDLLSDLHALARRVAVRPVSSETGAGFEELDRYLGRGRTICLLGSSGVGKSTLVNRLLGYEHLRTRRQRRDGAGRHTTTHRELVSLPGGALLIDNPGMREVGLSAAEHGVEETFDDVTSLAGGCRFNDCRHDSEPGCAVQAAVQHGALRLERLTSFRKLASELRRPVRRDRQAGKHRSR